MDEQVPLMLAVTVGPPLLLSQLMINMAAARAGLYDFVINPTYRSGAI